MDQNQGQNPFLKILGQQNQSQSTGMPNAEMLQSLMSQGSQGQGAMPSLVEDITQKGVTNDVTKPLLQALSALHQFIASGTDKQEIAVIRSIIAVLTNVIRRDQARSAQLDQQPLTQPGQQPMQQQVQQPPIQGQ